jgi:hypothetical protein
MYLQGRATTTLGREGGKVEVVGYSSISPKPIWRLTWNWRWRIGIARSPQTALMRLLVDMADLVALDWLIRVKCAVV